MLAPAVFCLGSSLSNSEWQVSIGQERYEQLLEIVIWQNLRPKFSEIYSGLLWSDQWQTVSPGKTGWNLLRFHSKAEALRVCYCVYTHVPLYKRLSLYVWLFVRSCVWHGTICVHKETSRCVPSQQEALHIHKQLRLQPSSWLTGRETGWSKRVMPQSNTVAAKSSVISPLTFHLIVSLLVQISAGRFVILMNTSRRAWQQILLRNFTGKTASPRVCFTFNDGDIRELGGSLLPLSPHASAPDYSLASDSQWWMA